MVSRIQHLGVKLDKIGNKFWIRRSKWFIILRGRGKPRTRMAMGSHQIPQVLLRHIEESHKNYILGLQRLIVNWRKVHPVKICCKIIFVIMIKKS